MNTKWRREELPYDAMGDFSAFEFEDDKEEAECEDRDRNGRKQEDNG